jgi:CRP/FNR family transcriptional regulator
MSSTTQHHRQNEECSADATNWCALGGEDLAILQGSGSTESISSGQTVFSQGEPVTSIVCLIEGTVAVHRSHGKEHSTLLRLLDSGGTLGLDSVFGSGIHSNSAVALTDCSICRISPNDLCGLMSKSPELIRKMLGRLAFDLQASDEARVNVVHLQVRARLAALLLALRDRHGSVDESGNLLIKLPLSRRDMASAIGTRPESLSRAIRALENDNVASFRGKRVLVQDLDDLLDEVEM